MNLKNPEVLVALLLNLLLASSAMALDSDRQQPLRIVADTAVIDEKDGTATYTGNVVLTQGTLRIAADLLKIRTAQGKVDVVKAEGRPAQFSQVPEENQQEVIAKASKIDYQVQAQKLILRQKASIVQNENIFRGEEIVYEIQSQRLQAVGQSGDVKPGDNRGRVEMILPAAAQPAPDKSADKATNKATTDTQSGTKAPAAGDQPGS